MKLIDVFYHPDLLDGWTFVTDDYDAHTGYYSMLGTDDTGRIFSQWTEGFYEPLEDNFHLGERPRYLPEGLLDHVLWRMSDGDSEH
jgi:hypothetical protein